MSTNKSRRDLLKAIKKLPVEVVETTTTSKGHLKFRVQRADGQVQFFVSSGSASDVRSYKNFIAMVAKWSKEGD